MKIPMFKVGSSNINSVGYDTKTRKLRIEFKNKAIFDYFDVAPELFNDLMDADSVGKFFHAHVRNKFKGKKKE